MPQEPRVATPRRRRGKPKPGFYKGPDITLIKANEPHPEGARARGTVAMCLRDKVSAQTTMSFILTDWSWINGPQEYVTRAFMIGNILTMQRNECVRLMEGDWILFIDSDMTWQPDAIKTLVETRDKFDLDIVGGLCFQRGEPYQPTMYIENPSGEGGYTFLETWDEDTAVEVDATGMAFCLIHKRVFERLLERDIKAEIEFVRSQIEQSSDPIDRMAMTNDLAFLEERLREPFPDLELRKSAPSPNFFRWSTGYGEDFQFCREAKEVGCKVFVDTSVKIGHIGDITINENTFYREIATRDDAGQVLREGQLKDVGHAAMTREEARRRLGWT